MCSSWVSSIVPSENLCSYLVSLFFWVVFRLLNLSKANPRGRLSTNMQTVFWAAADRLLQFRQPPRPKSICATAKNGENVVAELHDQFGAVSSTNGRTPIYSVHPSSQCGDVKLGGARIVCCQVLEVSASKNDHTTFSSASATNWLHFLHVCLTFVHTGRVTCAACEAVHAVHASLPERALPATGRCQ